MGRTKVPVAVRFDPDIKAVGMLRAEEDRRSFAAYLEWLIIEDITKRPPQSANKESAD